MIRGKLRLSSDFRHKQPAVPPSIQASEEYNATSKRSTFNTSSKGLLRRRRD
jgi:hypothetical protein